AGQSARTSRVRIVRTTFTNAMVHTRAETAQTPIKSQKTPVNSSSRLDPGFLQPAWSELSHGAAVPSTLRTPTRPDMDAEVAAVERPAHVVRWLSPYVPFTHALETGCEVDPIVVAHRPLPRTRPVGLRVQVREQRRKEVRRG